MSNQANEKQELKRLFMTGFNEFLNDYGGSYHLMDSLAKRAHIQPVMYVFLTCLGGYNVSDDESLSNQFLGEYCRIKIIAPVISGAASATRRKVCLSRCATIFENGVVSTINGI